MPCQPPPARTRARVDRPLAAVGVAAPDDAGPAGRLRPSACVSSASERPTRSSWPSSAAPAGLENVSVPSLVGRPDPVRRRPSTSAGRAQLVDRAAQLGHCARSASPSAVSRARSASSGLASRSRRAQPRAAAASDDHDHREHPATHRRDMITGSGGTPRRCAASIHTLVAVHAARRARTIAHDAGRRSSSSAIPTAAGSCSSSPERDAADDRPAAEHATSRCRGTTRSRACTPSSCGWATTGSCATTGSRTTARSSTASACAGGGGCAPAT